MFSGNLEYKNIRFLFVIIIGVVLGVLTSIQPIFTLILILSVSFLFFTVRYTNQAFFLGILFIVLEGFIASFFTSELIQNVIGLIPELIFSIVLVLLIIKSKFSLPSLKIYDYILFIIILWSLLISIIQHSDPYLLAFGFRSFFRLILMYWIIRIIGFSRKILLEKLVTLLVILVLFEFGVVLFQIIGKNLIGPSTWNTFGDNLVMSSSTFGAQGTFNRYDALGMFFGFSSIILLGFFVFYEHKKLYLFAFFLSIFGIITSTSRQALVVAVIGALIIFASPLKNSNKGRLLFSGIYIIALLSLIGYFILPDELLSGEGRNPFELIGSLFDASTYSTEKNQNFRLYFITQIGSWLIHNHFWGMGLGTFGATFSFDQFEWLYRSLGLTDNFLNYTADVNWISILGQLGVVGVVGFVVFFSLVFFSLFYKGIKKQDGLLIITAAITITWAISGLFGPNFEIKSNAMFFWIFLGLSLKNLTYNEGDCEEEKV